MNKIVIAIAAAVIIGGGLWFALMHQNSDMETSGESQETVQEQSEKDDSQAGPGEGALQEEPSPSEEQSQNTTVEVVYSDSGFEPVNITVNTGDTVFWTNESSSAMWVASDDHPIHNDYPGFDQLGNGQNYSFTFEQSGTWGYHNHSNHSQGGTVTVN